MAADKTNPEQEADKPNLIPVEQRAFASTPPAETEPVIDKTFVQPKDEPVIKDGEKLQFPPGIGEGKIAGGKEADVNAGNAPKTEGPAK